MKAGGPVESGLQACHNKYLAVNLPNNLGFQGLSEGFTGVFKGFFKRALKPYIARTYKQLGYACSGIPHTGMRDEWMAKIVGGDVRTCRHLADAYW